MKVRTDVTRIPFATREAATAHFEAKLGFETDCWDVHHGLGVKEEFVLVDVRSPTLFAGGHVDGALNIPHAQLSESRLEGFAPDTLFVVYCAGPHCNSADKAALRLARLRRPVKLMIGGVTGWIDEGFTLTEEAAA